MVMIITLSIIVLSIFMILICTPPEDCPGVYFGESNFFKSGARLHAIYSLMDPRIVDIQYQKFNRF